MAAVPTRRKDGKERAMLYLSPFITVYCCILAAVLGACMGSFLNCMAWRIVHGQSVWRGRSHCDECGHVLSVRDLVPIFSYAFSRGRCRYCGARLSARHVLCEGISAAVFVSLLLKYDISLQGLEALLLACVLLAASFTDLEGYIIPDRFIMVGIVLFICSEPLASDPLGRAKEAALGGFAVAGGLLLVSLVIERALRREAMGGGDIKLLFVTGLFLGWRGNLLCLILACIIGIVFALIAAKRRDGARAAIPWGPSIALGAWLTALFGQPLIDWYFSLL